MNLLVELASMMHLEGWDVFHLQRLKAAERDADDRHERFKIQVVLECIRKRFSKDGRTPPISFNWLTNVLEARLECQLSAQASSSSDPLPAQASSSSDAPPPSAAPPPLPEPPRAKASRRRERAKRKFEELQELEA
eukprot:NODE_4080_length_713_cov_1.471125.p1 GENE.NODE_4080_length_713_cov_1.471125~~NODE_4080_length_713_cov_1.471125.p1  ORF type:complete len:136 (+),score=33.00 NODE_4080_length_713_cov_1.471125:285-692(+)